VSLLQSLVLGIVQGLTEFLPISSTAHLVLTPYFFFRHEPPASHTFDVALHVGTLLALLLYFWRDFAGMATAWLRSLGRLSEHARVRREEDSAPPKLSTNARLAWLVILGCIPAAIVGALFNDQVEALADPRQNPRALAIIGGSMIIVGLLMWGVERIALFKRDQTKMNAADALLIGVAQAIALVPGVSRSGATMTAGLLAGLTREAAARFSFLLSAPIIFGAILFKAVKISTRGGIPEAERLHFIVGIIASALVGYACIAWLIAWLRKRSLAPFIIYRIAVGLFVLGLYFSRSGR
jgi:undecaprenyl-diphosphatase